MNQNRGMTLGRGSVIRGTLLESENDTPLARLEVEVGYWADRRFEVVASAFSDASGAFVLDLDAALGDAGLQKRPRRFDLRVKSCSGTLSVKSGLTSWRAGEHPGDEVYRVDVAARATLYNDPWDLLEKLDGQEQAGGQPNKDQAQLPVGGKGEGVVYGLVRHVNGRAVEGVVVKAYDFSIQGERELGVSDPTDSEGKYVVYYPGWMSQVRPLLFVRVESSGSPTEVIGVSGILHRPLQSVRIDVEIEHSAHRGDSEYAMLHKALSPILDGEPVIDLSTLDARRLAALALRSGCEYEKVGAYVTARRLGTQTQVSSEAVYGLLRGGFASNVSRLLGSDPASVVRALEEAANAGVISIPVGQEAEAAASKLRQGKVDRSLSPDTPRSLGRLLACTTLPDPDKRRFVEVLESFGGRSSPAFWAEVRKETVLGVDKVSKIQRALRLGRLTANHAPLVAVIESELAGQPLRLLAAKSVADWKAMIEGDPAVGCPSGVLGDTPAERLDNYAKLIHQLVRAGLPSASASLALQQKYAGEPLATILDGNPDFDFGWGVAETDLAKPPGMSEEDFQAGTSKLKAYTRLFRMGLEPGVTGWDRNQGMFALAEQGVTSSFQVVRRGKTAFIKTYADLLGGAEAALQIYKKAELRNALVVVRYLELLSAVRSPRMAVLENLDLDTSPVPGIPDLETLFGSLDFCQCEHCRSVLSPAAYMVDLLAWIRDRGGLDALYGGTSPEIGRRADIGRIELTCENTNRTLPYVDLVLEILENAIDAATDAPVDQSSTEASSEELLANPQNIRKGAYEVLKAAVYPPGLPFHLPLEQARVWLEHLGVGRAELMRIFQTEGSPPTPTDAQIASERLGLGPQVFALVTTTSGSPWQRWGYSSEYPGGGAAWYDQLASSVEEIRARGEVEVDDLLDLLHVRWLNPTGALELQAVDECDLSTWSLVSTGSPIGASDFERLVRILRLWRALGWTTMELDAALDAFGAADLDSTLVEHLGNVVRLRGELKTELMPMLAWWGLIATREERDAKSGPVTPLSDQVFLNPTVFSRSVLEDETEPFPLLLNEDRTEIASLGVPMSSVVSELQAAMAVASEDLEAAMARVLVELEPAPLSPDALPLNLANLSAVYRIVTLAQAVGLSVVDCLALIDLTGLDPFGSPAAAHAWIAEVKSLAEAGFSADDLRYLLGHHADAAQRVAPTDDWLRAGLGKIRDDLRALRDGELDETEAASDGALRSLLATVVVSDDETVDVGTAIDELVEVISGQFTTSPEDEELQRALLVTWLGAYLDAAEAWSALAKMIAGSAERYEYAIAALRAGLLRIRMVAVIVEDLAELLDRESPAIDALRGRAFAFLQGSPSIDDFTDVFLDEAFLDAAADVSGDPWADLTWDEQPRAFDTLECLWKVATILNRLSVDTDEQAWWLDQLGATRSFDLLDLCALPMEETDIALLGASYRQLDRAIDLFSFRDRLPGTDPVFIDLMDWLLAGDLGGFWAALAARTDWNLEDLDHLSSPAAFSYDTDDSRLFEPEELHLVVDRVEAIRRLGTSAEQIMPWRLADPDWSTADAIVTTARSRYDSTAAWSAVAQPVRDELRERRQAALVSYLVGNDDSFEDENDLYGYFLVDVQTSSCMVTSRIVLANSSLQMFVQRWMLGLEVGLPDLSEEDREQWEWMKNYRVWEAARKVFLYPENWIEPELLDEKSPFFEELESQLQQNELTDENVERAALDYLDKLAAVANLQVVGVYWEKENDQDSLHVVARTWSAPASYYYRRWEDRTWWTPWEEIPLDVKGNHVIPVVHNRRLMLFWAEFSDRREDDNGSTGSAYWDIQMYWAEYRDGAWSPKRVSEESLSTSVHARSDERYYTFQASVDDGILSITCEQRHAFDTFAYVGAFVLNPCTLSLTTIAGDGNDQDGAVRPSHSTIWNQGFRIPTTISDALDGESSLALRVGVVSSSYELAESQPDTLAVLDLVTEPTYVMCSQQFDEFVCQAPFFVQDSECGFLVVPTKTIPGPRCVHEDSTTDCLSIAGLHTFFDQDELVIQEVEPMRVEMRFQQDTAMVDRLLDPVQQIADPAVGEPPYLFTFDPLVQTCRTDTGSYEMMACSAENVNSMVAFSDCVMTDNFIQWQTGESFAFQLFYHPWVCAFIEAIRKDGIWGLYAPEDDVPTGQAQPNTLARQQLRSVFFDEAYKPVPGVVEGSPEAVVDFGWGTPYSQYNWELFFHLPMLVANTLSADQQFEAAMGWYHAVFDPLNRNTDYEVPYRFWKLSPFLVPVGASVSHWEEFTTDASGKELADFANQVAQWRDDPFNPHLMARLRHGTYQRMVVMKYLDNLIAWGDHLFAQDSIESCNEAMQLYVLAQQMLGDRPDELPARHALEVKCFDDIADELDSFSNVLIELENTIPETDVTSDARSSNVLPAVARSAYFCVVPNEDLLAYWDTVEDRLYKLRNCMNLAGEVRQLPLFQPPIDPAMLVRASAMGVDLGTVLADLNAPLPYHRFSVTAQKAQAFCGSVRALGSALLSALEKKDGEELALLRQSQEITMLGLARSVREQQVSEAEEALAGARQARKLAEQRETYYAGLIDKGLLSSEKAQDKNRDAAAEKQKSAQIIRMVGALLGAVIPQFHAGLGFTAETGGRTVAQAADLLASWKEMKASELRLESEKAGTRAGRTRRKQEWDFQLELAKRELDQHDKQILAAEIRLAIAEAELANHDKQVDNAKTIETWMKSKYTSKELYSWMVGQVSTLYFQSYQLAYGMAKRAQACFRHELGLPDATFVQYGYWDSLKKGLLAGERLQLDLERMEAAYLEKDKREYEITKHVSLDLLDPSALVALRETGSCYFECPEVLFDLDFPGQYFRRIKSVSLTIPGVVGPHTGVSCKLTLTSSRTRVSASTAADYAESDPGGLDDSRFRYETSLSESIATSTGQNDSGLFQFDFNDARYLPFERRGAISRWRLQLTGALPQFDWDSIGDVVLTMRYTAREGGDALAEKVKADIQAAVERFVSETRTDAEPGLMRAFSASRSFPSEWRRFLYPQEGEDHVLEVELTEAMFPFPFREILETERIDIVLVDRVTTSDVACDYEWLSEGESAPDAGSDPLSPGGAGIIGVALPGVTLPNESTTTLTNTTVPGALTLTIASGAITTENVEDLLFIVHYSVSS